MHYNYANWHTLLSPCDCFFLPALVRDDQDLVEFIGFFVPELDEFMRPSKLA